MTTAKPPYPSQTADKYIVRLPEGLRTTLANAAQANNRTMNAEFVARLQGSFNFVDNLPPVVRDAVQDAVAANKCTPEAALTDLVTAGQANGGLVLNIRIAPGMTIKEVHKLLTAMMKVVPDPTLVSIERE